MEVNDIHIGIVGFEAVGKTTILKRFRNSQSGPIESYSEEVRNEHLQVPGLRISIWDLAPPNSLLLPGYHLFFTNEIDWESFDGIICLVSLTNLFSLLNLPRLIGTLDIPDLLVRGSTVFEMLVNGTDVPIAVFYNKMDLVEMKESIPIGVHKFLQLENFADRPVGLFFTSGKTGEGLLKGFKWLFEALAEKGSNSETMKSLSQWITSVDFGK